MLTTAIKQYLKKYGIANLSRATGVTDQTIMNFLHGKRTSKRTLDRFYKFFKLDIDSFYISALTSWYSSTNGIWSIVQLFRLQMGRSQEEFSKMIGVDTRTLQRIEANKNPPKKKTFDLIVQLRKEYFWWEA